MRFESVIQRKGTSTGSNVKEEKKENTNMSHLEREKKKKELSDKESLVSHCWYDNEMLWLSLIE